MLVRQALHIPHEAKGAGPVNIKALQPNMEHRIDFLTTETPKTQNHFMGRCRYPGRCVSTAAIAGPHRKE